MSLHKLGGNPVSIEKSLGCKIKPDYHPTLSNTSPHPNSNQNQPDHQINAFSNYWREPLPTVEKFKVNPNVKMESDKADFKKYVQEEAILVKNLGGKEEPSEDMVTDPKALAKGKKK
ncbi:Conserved_hypothetical protein [Hexamita inflata]|uniref:Uncharacterized protein n=1 Tax=Hexamita inflata TaxID=28002 RepID=A0AA86R396_9EUKA|nr:Conserved hypothetical protein [Hexamita inflata]